MDLHIIINILLNYFVGIEQWVAARTLCKPLKQIVDELNNGDMELEKAIVAYEKGIKLKNICEAKLKNAQERIELIKAEKKE